MKCLIINLNRANERKKHISDQLNLISQKFEFIEGVDWKDLDHSILKYTKRNIRIKNSYRTLTLGQMGCNLSHRKILNWLTTSSERMIAVLEDDVFLSRNLPEVLSALETTQKKFDIVFLGSRFNQEELVDLFELDDKYHFSLSIGREKGAWGYVITKDAAKEFLRVLPAVTGPIDDALHAYFVHGLKTYTLNPQIVFHELEGRKFSYNKENKSERLAIKEEIMRFISLICEHFSHKFHFKKRINLERVAKTNGV